MAMTLPPPRQPNHKPQRSTYFLLHGRLLLLLAPPQVRDVVAEETLSLAHLFNTLEALVFTVLGSEVAEGGPAGRTRVKSYDYEIHQYS